MQLNNIWFTSDTHFNHHNICEYSNRPFESLDQMTETLIQNWNKRVRPGDIVYHLGDFALTRNIRDQPLVDSLLSRLNGNKWLIRGNHDREAVYRSPKWNKVEFYHELKVDLGGIHKQRIVLCHYSMRVWNQMHRGSWMLFGHSHGNLGEVPGRTMDVGVDSHNYYPIHLDEVVALVADKDIITLDHHTP